MKFNSFIEIYFTIAIIMAFIIFIILICTSHSENSNYTLKENIIFYILTAMTAIVWPLLLVYLFYLNYKDKERISRNKRLYKKYHRYFMNMQLTNTFINKVLHMINAFYYAPENVEYNDKVVMTWTTDNGSKLEITCSDDESIIVTIIPYYEAIKNDQGILNANSIHMIYSFDQFESINKIVDNFIDKVYDDQCEEIKNASL